MLARFVLSLAVASASLGAALPVDDFFKAHQPEERSVGYCTFDLSQFEPVVLVGNPNGAPSFCESEWGGNYKPIQQINLWWNSYQLEGIQAIYTDTVNSPVYGTTNAPSSAVIGVNYGAGDRWKQWTTWYNPQGDGRVSGFTIAATNGQILHAGYSVDQLSQMGVSGQDQNVGNGFLFGFEGQSIDPNVSDGVTRLGALFLSSPIANIQITNVQFPNGPIGSPVTNVESLAQAHYYNSRPASDSQWNFMNSLAIGTSQTFTSTTTYTYGGSVSFTFSGDFLIVKASNTDTFTWGATYGSMNAYAQTSTTTVTWAESGSLSPGQGVDCQAIVGHGSGTFGYSATAVVTLNNGFQFSYPEGGALQIDDISTAVVTVAENDNP